MEGDGEDLACLNTGSLFQASSKRSLGQPSAFILPQGPLGALVLGAASRLEVTKKCAIGQLVGKDLLF